MNCASSRFPLAVHLLVALSYRPHDFISSESLSGTIATNPVVVRRAIALLRAAGLVSSQTGAAGGARLARSAATITLLDVYRAVEPDSVFTMHTPNPKCPIGRGIPEVLGAFLPEVEKAMEQALARMTIRQVARKVLPSYRVPAHPSD
jgi:Rrf2 family protein